MSDEQNMFIENVDLDENFELSSTDSELEMLNCGQMTDTFDNTDSNRDTLSNFSLSEETEQPEERFDDVDFPFYSTSVISEGRRLYLIYLQNEILKSRINLPDYLVKASKIIDCTLCKNIYSLHKLLTRFEISAQRKYIRDEAKDLIFQGLSFKSYTDKLKKLFDDARVSWEKVLVIFAYCADVSIRALNSNSERQFEKIQDWTLVFIDGFICTYVQAEGGWDVILHQSYTPAMKMAVITFCCVGIITLFVFIKSNSKAY